MNNKNYAPYQNVRRDDDSVVNTANGVNDDGSQNVRVIQPVVKDSWEGSSTITRNFDMSMTDFSIANDGGADLSFAINGLTITVKPSEVFDGQFDPFDNVTITTTVPYRAIVKG